jgi:hypothetical protein
MYFGTTIDKDRSWPALARIGYQLLSALAGTLADARTDGATCAVVLVHEFGTNKTAGELHALNARVLDDFMTRMGFDASSIAHVPGGWITASVEVRGDGTWAPRAIPVCLAKLVTDRR